MSYQVLARKWRPQTFADVVGQEHVLTALANGLSLGRIHHAYLFSGTRGVGKTSIARLLAKGLNCETGITATPCGVCDNCREIEQGRFVDLIEIDAASRTKVEDTRDLLVTLLLRLAREEDVTAARLALTGKRLQQILFSPCSFNALFHNPVCLMCVFIFR